MVLWSLDGRGRNPSEHFWGWGCVATSLKGLIKFGESQGRLPSKQCCQVTLYFVRNTPIVGIRWRRKNILKTGLLCMAKEETELLNSVVAGIEPNKKLGEKMIWASWTFCFRKHYYLSAIFIFYCLKKSLVLASFCVMSQHLIITVLHVNLVT